MNLTLSREMKKYVDREVLAGRYASAADVVRAALAIQMHRRSIEELPLEDLEAIVPNIRQDVAVGLQEGREGRVSDGEAFFDELEQEDGSGDSRKSA